LTPKLVQALISLQDWYRSEPIPINVEEDLEYLELLELGKSLIFFFHYIKNNFLFMLLISNKFFHVFVDMAHSGIESSIVDV